MLETADQDIETERSAERTISHFIFIIIMCIVVQNIV